MRKSTLLWVLTLAMSIPAIAQNLTVTGKVSDENNQPLAAATVQEKGHRTALLPGLMEVFPLA
jgi:hypothetical protein